MVFTSTVFLFLFLPVVLAIYYYPPLRRHRTGQNYFLLFASLVFYAWGEPVFVFLMIGSIILTWLIGLRINSHEDRAGRKRVLTIGIICHVTLLFIFKYLTFFSQEFNRFSGFSTFQIDISLPIGISFFTFQMMSYLFDVYYRKAKVQKNILNLGLYVALFPQLIAGPIVRYETVEDEILHRVETKDDFIAGIRRFVIGLGKKALLADFLAVIADNIFSLVHVGSVTALTAWIGAVSYTLQIYFDFSGYSDMAIGLGLCFGFHFRENFNHPYCAVSVRDFWRRWHISLTDWFRDYVYIPLGGNRAGKRRQIWNTVLVWILTGIWHGANWTFLLWGLIYCLLQLAETHLLCTDRWPRFLQHMYTLLLVCLCWVLFRAQSAGDAIRYFSALFGRCGFTDAVAMWYLRNSSVILTISVLSCLPLPPTLHPSSAASGISVAREVLIYIMLTAIVILTVIFSISGSYSPFIYFNF